MDEDETDEREAMMEVEEQESEHGLGDEGAADDDGDDDDDEDDLDIDIEDNKESGEDSDQADTDMGQSEKQKRKSNSSQRPFDDFKFMREEDTITKNVTQEEMSSQAGAWADGDKVCSAAIKKDRRFVCVAYPGVVQNTEKAIATLGGRDGITKALSENLKLELTFRPKDTFAKPTVGSFIPTKSLLVKVRRRPKMPVAEPGGSSSACSAEFEYQLEVLGVIDKLYTFDRFCDFQYLPVTKQADGTYKELLSHIKPNIDDDRQEYLSRDVPLYLPPFTFSKREKQVPYTFGTETVTQDEQEQKHCALNERKHRNTGTIFITYNHPGVPTEPPAKALQNLKHLPEAEQVESIRTLKAMFEKRPVWSKMGLMANLDKKYHVYLKTLLPVVSFYFTAGPWRSLWCKYGYDPRKDRAAKMYQTVDYRVRSTLNKNKVEAKRGLEIYRYHHLGQKQQMSATLVQDEKDENVKNPIDLTYKFSPRHRPPYRQMRYQICDVQLDEVQKLAHENDGQETQCTERDGWCVPDFTDTCRDIINDVVDHMLTQ